MPPLPPEVLENISFFLEPDLDDYDETYIEDIEDYLQLTQVCKATSADLFFLKEIKRWWHLERLNDFVANLQDGEFANEAERLVLEKWGKPLYFEFLKDPNTKDWQYYPTVDYLMDMDEKYERSDRPEWLCKFVDEFSQSPYNCRRVLS